MPRNCWTRCNKTFPCSFPAREKTREIERRETSKRLEKQAILALLRKMIYKYLFVNIVLNYFYTILYILSIHTVKYVITSKKEGKCPPFCCNFEKHRRALPLLLASLQQIVQRNIKIIGNPNQFLNAGLPLSVFITADGILRHGKLHRQSLLRHISF